MGAPFCGAAVRPNMLNMPKSAAETNAENKNSWRDLERLPSTQEEGQQEDSAAGCLLFVWIYTEWSNKK